MSEAKALYLLPHKEAKVWGKGGIGEWWFGAEKENFSMAETGEGLFPMPELLDNNPERLLGKEAMKKFGISMPLVKILTPKSRLSVQFHEKKDELWVVTGIDRKITGEKAEIILGFNSEMIDEYGAKITDMYRETLVSYGHALNELIDLLEKDPGREHMLRYPGVLSAAEALEDKTEDLERKIKELVSFQVKVNSFYNYLEVQVGDVIPVPRGTLHALGGGIEVVEPQIPGSTQSTEDGDTYPVRYYFPGHKRDGAKKALDIDRIKELDAKKMVLSESEVVCCDDKAKVERLPGGFEKKGLSVRRVTLERGASFDLEQPRSLHILVSVKGRAFIAGEGERSDIPMARPDGKMMLVPSELGKCSILAETQAQIIDTFVPV